MNETFEVIEAIDRAPDRASILQTVAAALSRFGFTGFIMTGLPADGDELEQSILLNGWPADWLERYVEAGHYEHDPCASYCRTTAAAFTWDEIPQSLTAESRATAMLAETGEFGFRQGLCVPLHSAGGLRGMSMAGWTVELPKGARRMAQLLSIYACSAIERIAFAQAPGRRLTEREREVLRWIAVGKTVGDVGEILGLSSHTVGEHLKNIRRKLGTGNNVHTVVEALRLREIRL